MSDSDSLESESEQPLAKNAKSHYDTLSSDSSQHTQQSSQCSQNIIIETGHNQDQLNTRHTINVIINNKRIERQQRYREQNRDKLKQREVERRKSLQYLLSIAGPSSTSSNINSIELNNEETIAAIPQSSSGLEGSQTSSIQKNEQAKEKNALQKRNERQQRYREKNREKLNQHRAEKRKRLQYLLSIAGPLTSSNINRTELNNKETIAAISKNLSCLEGIQISSIQRKEMAKGIIALQKHRKHQQTYRKKNREKLSKRKAERRKCIKYLQSIAGPSTSSNINRTELNDEETVAAISQSSSGVEGTHTSSIQRNEQAKENNALQKKRERQQRYRDKNREKLSKRKAEYRKRIKYLQSIAGPSTSSNINRIELNDKETVAAKENNALQKKRERQQRYRDKNREKLRQRKAESRKRIKYLQSIAGPSTSSNINRTELNYKETVAAISQSSSGVEGTHVTSSIQRNEQAPKKRERQQRYRENNREKLRQRKAERRKRLKNAEMITELSTSPNIEFTEIIN